MATEGQIDSFTAKCEAYVISLRTIGSSTPPVITGAVEHYSTVNRGEMNEREDRINEPIALRKNAS